MSLTLTENSALTYSSSEDPRLDFFFHAIEGADEVKVFDLLEKSWKFCPLSTMKIIFNCRDIRKGKGNRPIFLICLKWLFVNQLPTLLANLKHFAEFGCWKDFLNLLQIVLFDTLTHDCST